MGVAGCIWRYYCHLESLGWKVYKCCFFVNLVSVFFLCWWTIERVFRGFNLKTCGSYIYDWCKDKVNVLVTFFLFNFNLQCFLLQELRLMNKSTRVPFDRVFCHKKIVATGKCLLCNLLSLLAFCNLTPSLHFKPFLQFNLAIYWMSWLLLWTHRWRCFIWFLWYMYISSALSHTLYQPGQFKVSI